MQAHGRGRAWRRRRRRHRVLLSSLNARRLRSKSAEILKLLRNRCAFKLERRARCRRRRRRHALPRPWACTCAHLRATTRTAVARSIFG